jgi:hypothetical protein
MGSKYTATVKWYTLYNGKILLVFENFMNGASRSQVYKTKAAAKAAETRFYNILARIYG